MDLKQKSTMENNIKELINVINNEYALNIFEDTREKEYVEARAIFSNIMYRHHKVGYTDIGRMLGKKHGSIFNYIKKIETWIKHDQVLRDKYYNILEAYSCGMRTGTPEETSKVWYENIILKSKLEKIEQKMNHGIHSMIETIPEEKKGLIRERLESIIRMNC